MNLRNTIENLVISIVIFIIGAGVGYKLSLNAVERTLDNQQGIIIEAIKKETTAINNNVATNELDLLPIRTIDFKKPTDVNQHDKMVTLVERMLTLNENKASEKNPEKLRHIEADIQRTDRQIDRLVYDLYELSEEEIQIVESGS